jgi:hypothetical protein
MQNRKKHLIWLLAALTMIVSAGAAYADIFPIAPGTCVITDGLDGTPGGGSAACLLNNQNFCQNAGSSTFCPSS